MTRFVAAVVSSGLIACSSVESLYVRAGYDVTADGAVKRIAVVAWSPPEHPLLGKVLSTVAGDRLRLKMNYLVHHTGVVQRGWSDACGELEGVLLIYPRDVTADDEEMTLDLVAELHSCKTGELLWRAEASDEVEFDDDDLVHLTQSYVRQLGKEASHYAATAFIVVRELLDTLPNPVLTDDEIMEKIELSRAPGSAPHSPEPARRAITALARLWRGR